MSRSQGVQAGGRNPCLAMRVARRPRPTVFAPAMPGMTPKRRCLCLLRSHVQPEATAAPSLRPPGYCRVLQNSPKAPAKQGLRYSVSFQPCYRENGLEAASRQLPTPTCVTQRMSWPSMSTRPDCGS